MDLPEKDILPDTLHELLALAIKDAKALDTSKYMPNFLAWHVYNEHGDGLCEVCLTGAVLAQSLNVDIKETVQSVDIYGSSIGNKLIAVNYLRAGYVIEAAWALYGDNFQMPQGVGAHQPMYHSSFRGWQKFYDNLDELGDLQALLEEHKI